MSNNPTDSGDSYSDDPGKKQGSIIYVLGVSLALIVLILIVFYVSYKCRRNIRFGLPPDPEDDDEDQHPMRLSEGLDEDVLMTFPSYVYSDDMMPHKGVNDSHDTHGSGCPICLADYKPVDVVRLLPKCDHLFHRTCIDTWLRVHPTCPVCRNSPLPAPLANTAPLSHSVLDIRLEG